MSTIAFSDLVCPRCGHHTDFHVDVSATAYLDARGPAVESEYFWDDRSCCTCLACNFESCVGDFVTKKAVMS